MMITAAVLVFLAIPLFVFGLRGRRVDDHPVCGRCKFDLVGVYPDRLVCPECGSGLEKAVTARGSETSADVADAAPARVDEATLDGEDATRATRPAKTTRVRIGNRIRGRVLIVFSLIVWILAASIAGLSTQSIDWDRHKPFAILRLELYWSAESNPTRMRELLGEIFWRLDRNKLKEEQLGSLVELALRVQANPDATWIDRWAEVIERYDDAAGLSKEQLFAYYKSGGLVTVTSRDSVRIGDEVLVRMRLKPTRIGVGRPIYLRVKVVRGSIGEGEAAVPIVPPPVLQQPTNRPVMLSAERRGQGSTTMRDIGYLIELDGQLSEIGTQPLTLEFQFQPTQGWDDEDLLGQWTETHELSINVLPRDDTDIELFGTDVWEPTEDDVVVDSLDFRIGNDGSRYLIGKLTIEESYPFAFTAVGIVGDTRYDLGTLTRDWLQQGGQRHFQLYAQKLPDGFDAQAIDIELKYNRVVARKMMSMNKIYPLDMLIKDVPVEYPEPTPEPDN